MPTMKQKALVTKIVENNGNVSKSMREVGYSAIHAQNPQVVTQSKGFLELCDELGLTDNLIVNALVEDIKIKKQNRKPELELAAKMRGRIKDNQQFNTVIVAPIFGGKASAVEAVDPDLTTPE